MSSYVSTFKEIYFEFPGIFASVPFMSEYFKQNNIHFSKHYIELPL